MVRKGYIPLPTENKRHQVRYVSVRQVRNLMTSIESWINQNPPKLTPQQWRWMACIELLIILQQTSQQPTPSSQQIIVLHIIINHVHRCRRPRGRFHCEGICP